MIQSEVVVQIQIPGFHNWPKAPKEVSFLREKHRHIFHIKAYAKVQHNDRDKEFFILQAKLKRELYIVYVNSSQGINFEDLSCEAIATDLLERLYTFYKIEVWEDGENGAVVTRHIDIVYK